MSFYVCVLPWDGAPAGAARRRGAGEVAAARDQRIAKFRASGKRDENLYW